MPKTIFTLLGVLLAAMTFSCDSKAPVPQTALPPSSSASSMPTTLPTVNGKVALSDEEWRKRLTPQQYYVLREKGTDRPNDPNGLEENHAKGMYYCAACGQPLFSSDNKYDSGCGWPAFSGELAGANIVQQTDADGDRIELLCPRCGGHLGHIFNDGPPPLYKRYCIDSSALKFVPGK